MGQLEMTLYVTSFSSGGWPIAATTFHTTHGEQLCKKFTITYYEYREDVWIPYPKMYRVKYSDEFTRPVGRMCTTTVVDDVTPECDISSRLAHLMRKSLLGY